MTHPTPTSARFVFPMLMALMGMASRLEEARGKASGTRVEKVDGAKARARAIRHGEARIVIGEASAAQ